MDKKPLTCCLIALLILTLSSRALSQQNQSSPANQPPTRQLLVHYMPWFVAKPHSPIWGWHWTMNKFDPDRRDKQGKRQIAAQYYPSIGPYDSADPQVIEYHFLTMKLAGIDGIIVDWYGREDLHDYALLHANTQQLFSATKRFDLTFAVCYEDKTIPNLIAAKRLQASQRVAHAVADLAWLEEHWFHHSHYARFDGKPLLLSFGQSGLNNREWESCLRQHKTPVAYFSQHHRRPGAVGAFDWPLPKEGLSAIRRFEQAATSWEASIAVAFPRFVDFYEQAGVHASWGKIPDKQGETFRQSLKRAFESPAPLIQLATWNDWSEGTMLEPSHEFGVRDLAVLQQFNRQYRQTCQGLTAQDLVLPEQLLRLRRENRWPTEVLDNISRELAQGNLAAARNSMAKLSKRAEPNERAQEERAEQERAVQKKAK